MRSSEIRARGSTPSPGNSTGRRGSSRHAGKRDQQSTRKDNGSRKTAAVAVDRRERGAAQGGGEGEKQWGMFCSASSARPSVPLLLPRPTVVRRDAPVRQSVIKSGEGEEEGAGWVWAVISLLPLSAPTATTARAAPATIATRKNDCPTDQREMAAGDGAVDSARRSSLRGKLPSIRHSDRSIGRSGGGMGWRAA